jgi:hypothetical protein
MNGGAACPSDSTKNCSGELDCTPTIPSGWNDENECYLARYVDLRAAFGKNISAAGRHWNSYGSGEGRNRSCTLSDKEAECYATRYSDVDAGSGLNEVRRHYYETGMGEHRDFTCEPGVKELTCYVKRYPDLQNAFGTNYNITNSWNHTLYRALNHWNVFGKREGRNISCS